MYGAIGALYLGVTAYGAWHARTHATFAVQLIYKSDTGIAGQLRNGQLTFRDAEERVLARASIDTRRSVVWLSHPEKGQCGPSLDKSAYRECFDAQSEWIPQWVDAVRYADIVLERCSIAKVNVAVHSKQDGLLHWWLPRASTFEPPYKRHNAALVVDIRRCS